MRTTIADSTSNSNDPATVGFEDQSDELEGGMAAFESSLKHEMHVSLGLWYFFIESARKEEQRDKGSPLRSEISKSSWSVAEEV